MPDEHRRKAPWLPPRWFIWLAWSVHRGVYRVCGGRIGLWRPRAKKWGALRLTTMGRRSGRQRVVDRTTEGHAVPERIPRLA